MSRCHRSSSPDDTMDECYSFDPTSPTDEYSSDESSASSSSSSSAPSVSSAPRPTLPLPLPLATAEASSSRLQLPTATATAKPPAHPYRQPLAPPPSRPLRPRGMGLAPLSAATHSLPLGTGTLPKSQPLARALFARKANDSPGLKKKASSTKMIVPTKGFRTTFELDLTARELARR